MKKIFLGLIIFWIVLACFNVLYNTNKSFSEAKEWATLSTPEKRHKVFGDIYDFIAIIDTQTDQHAQILIFSQIDITHLLSRYYLFPRITKTTDNKAMLTMLVKSKKYEYVASYNSKLKIDNYKEIGMYRFAQSKNIGYLYKRQ